MATARPARTRTAPAKTTPAKAAPAKAAESAPEPTADAPTEHRTVVELVKIGDTTKYSKWQPDGASGCVGNIYLPLGTARAGVVFFAE